MRLVRPLLSNVVRFVGPVSPPVQYFVPDFIRAVQERYEFWEVPRSMAEYRQDAGATFATGKFKGTTISAVQLFGNALKVEGETDTASLDEMATDFLNLMSDQFGVGWMPATPVPKGFVSSVEVIASPNLRKQLTLLKSFTERLTMMVASQGFTLATYQMSGFTLRTEESVAAPLPPGRFVFEVRAGHPVNGDVYYAEAPVPTEQLLELLELLEATLTNA